MIGKQLQALAVIDGEQCRGPADKRRGGRDVAARERASARRREAARPVLADRAAAIVERPELGEVRPCLLEVVAEDLLELGAAVAVDPVGPHDEALVEIRTAPLEDAVVRGVADHDVLEAVLRLVPVVDGTDQVLLGQRRDLRHHAR